MSLQVAVELLKPKLSAELQTAVANALAEGKSDSKIEIPYFAIGRIPPFEGIKHTVERRLIGSIIEDKNPTLEKCLREKLIFLHKSSVAESIQNLWMGFFVVSDSGKSFFLVDTKRKAIWTGRYP
jgi:hypothetical protein